MPRDEIPRCTKCNAETEKKGEKEGPDWDPEHVYEIFVCTYCGKVEMYKKNI